MSWGKQPKPSDRRRPMTQDELDNLLSEKAKAEDALERAVSQRTIEQIRWEIRSRNPVRWRRLQRDMKWAAKVMKKLGYNPEEVRWIL